MKNAITGIEQARRAAGLSLEEAAKRTRLHPRTIRQIECGTHPLSVLTLDRLRQAYGCSSLTLICSKRALRRTRQGRLSTNPTGRAGGDRGAATLRSAAR